MGLRVVLALLLIPAISRGGVEDRVRPALAVGKADDSLLVTYTMPNVSGATLRFFYNDGQQYDLASRAGGRGIWRWSAQMAFSQVVWEDSLAPRGVGRRRGTAAMAGGPSRGDPGSQSAYDLDNDGRVGFSGFFLFASSFGMIVPSAEG